MPEKKIPWDIIAPIGFGLVGGALPGLGRGVALGTNIWENMQQAKRMREVMAMQKAAQAQEQAAQGRMAEYLKGRASEYETKAQALSAPKVSYIGSQAEVGRETGAPLGGVTGYESAMTGKPPSSPLRREIFPTPQEIEEAKRATAASKTLQGAALLAEAGQIAPIEGVLRDVYKDEVAMALPFMTEALAAGRQAREAGATYETEVRGGGKVRMEPSDVAAGAADILGMAVPPGGEVSAQGAGGVKYTKRGEPLETPSQRQRTQQSVKESEERIKRIQALTKRAEADQKKEFTPEQAAKELLAVEREINDLVASGAKLFDPENYASQMERLEELRDYWESRKSGGAKTPEPGSEVKSWVDKNVPSVKR